MTPTQPISVKKNFFLRNKEHLKSFPLTNNEWCQLNTTSCPPGRYFPFGIVFLVAGKILEMDDPSAMGKKLGFYAITVVMGLILHGLFILPAMYFFITKKSPIVYIRGILQALLISLATSSRWRPQLPQVSPLFRLSPPPPPTHPTPTLTGHLRAHSFSCSLLPCFLIPLIKLGLCVFWRLTFFSNRTDGAELGVDDGLYYVDTLKGWHVVWRK